MLLVELQSLGISQAMQAEDNIVVLVSKARFICCGFFIDLVDKVFLKGEVLSGTIL